MPRYNFYSVIVPSFNRSEEIAELLKSFQQLNFPRERFELIVSDDGSSDDTPERVADFQRDGSFTLKLLTQENAGPGAARNHGMAEARGDFFIFIDSDCTVPPDWLAQIDRALNETRADAFGGPDTLRPDFPPLLKAINYSMTSFLTTGGIRGHRKKKMGKFYPRSFNMGLSRRLFEKIGGFGNLRHGQDIEFSHRIHRSGAKVIQIMTAPVYHKRRTSLSRFFRQVFNWGVARINLYKIDPGMLETVHFLPSLGVIGFLIVLALAFLSSPAGVFGRALLLFGLLLLLMSAVHGAVRYRDTRVLPLIPLVMPLQIIGYGSGFIYAFVMRVLLGRAELTGFRKKYYG